MNALKCTHLFSKVKQYLRPHDGIGVTTSYSGVTIVWETAGSKLSDAVSVD